MSMHVTHEPRHAGTAYSECYKRTVFEVMGSLQAPFWSDAQWETKRFVLYTTTPEHPHLQFIYIYPLIVALAST